MDNKTKYRIVASIRRCFSRSENAIETRRRRRKVKARYNKDGSEHAVPAVYYTCDECGEDFKANQVEVDHVSEVMKDGWISWDVFIENLFCDIDNLSLKCVSCHKKKTDKFKKEKATKGKSPKPPKSKP
jgi:hypothetical protein